MTENTGNIGFEETLWKAADKLRGSMDASEYKHVVLGLIFLKYISDKFETKFDALIEEGAGFEEDRDEYEAENIFWVPKEARWSFIKDNAKDPKIGQFIDDAMILIEKENTSLKGVLDKRYARPEIDKRRLGELIDLISTIKLHQNGEKDLLGRVYEYFLGQFASVEGKGGGEFYTPTSIVKTLVDMIEPYQGRVYDPCCGSGGMFVQSEKFVEDHQGRVENLSIYGQEMNSTTWKLCKMNLAIRGLDANLGPHHDDTFHHDLHKTLKADFILANPPFNISDWGGNQLTDDVRWKFGIPPAGNANYAWLQHMVYHLAPNGSAGIVLANGSLSTNTSNEGEIRKNLLEEDMVDAIVALPDKLFYSTGIPVSLWILNRNKKDNPKYRSREHEVLFIDARQLGEMIDRRHRELTEEDISKISETYHEWRNIDGEYEDIKGFCKSASIEDIREHEYVLTPGRYVGIEDIEDDGIPFDEKMESMTAELAELFAKSRHLEDEIRKNLGGIGYEF
ncbi:SAM-dependent DNA methyltransferase [Listeria monocytogenes]|uniref:class I SAM-dependent DNA methyltransferase n=1 Tax=Listeria innocua TaxID=1642 RepID=UPI0001EBB1F0|nr:class I SAM-dependent DNA methyltransferase [Listeria innocua]EAC2243909.1 SAM-dependent DNA methyltransferase [Listeria monocytogenes]EFR90471.1 putatIve type i restriction enzyme hindviip m protein [Listeria innocua FSL S4-378]EAC4576957.1 SAM-dependent DNA methyltransferase [Listeria monocytogenes]EAD9808519.1 SAM-dependent DNA methyltransferase [Listeria monocytogenes]EAD9808855.1 SAM-dependent DNA methyltransferase [Listeria monocytogenes]